MDLPEFGYTIPSSPGNSVRSNAYTPVGGDNAGGGSGGGGGGGGGTSPVNPEPTPNDNYTPPEGSDFCRLSVNELSKPPTRLPIPAKLKEGKTAGNDQIRITFPEPGEYKVSSQKYELAREYVAYFPGDEKNELVVFDDANGNCLMDAGERQITDLSDFEVVKSGDVADVHVKPGINILSLPIKPDSFSSADTLISWGAQHYAPFYEEGADTRMAPITTVGKFSNNLKKWTFLTNRAAVYVKSFGEDFLVKGDEPLYLISYADFDLRYRGRLFDSAPRQPVYSGWNLLGYMGYGDDYTGDALVEEFRTLQGLGDSDEIKLSEWNNSKSLFDNYVYKGSSLYSDRDLTLQHSEAIFYKGADSDTSSVWLPSKFKSHTWQDTDGVAHTPTGGGGDDKGGGAGGQGCVEPVFGLAPPADVPIGGTITFHFGSNYPYTHVGIKPDGESPVFEEGSCELETTDSWAYGQAEQYDWVWKNCKVVGGSPGEYRVKFTNSEDCNSTIEYTVVEGTASDNWWKYPDEILPTVLPGDHLLVLVNKKYKLSADYVPSGLMTFASWNTAHPDKNINVSNDSFQLREEVMLHLAELLHDMSAEGPNGRVISAYRSYTTQQATYQHWLDVNGGDVDATDKISARPGHSQHQLGTTVDFSTVIGDIERKFDDFTDTPAEVWLRQNAWKYGFALSYPQGAESITGYSPESWHYRYIGVENAKEWHNSNLVLDAWLRTKQQQV